MHVGDEIEVVNPVGDYFVQTIESMKNADNEEITVAPHPQMTVYMPLKQKALKYAMLRKKSV
jgi:putative protease